MGEEEAKQEGGRVVIPSVNVELPAALAQGAYANLVIVTHSPVEFVLDFAIVMPGLPKPRVLARVIMSPVHAKRFLRALQENIHRYEQAFGEIRIPQEMQEEGPFYGGMHGPQGQA